MRLDATDLRYITADEFRVLTAAEVGSKNHEVVPTTLIADLSGLRGGQVNKLCGALAKRNLIARVQNARYDGYRLTYGGLDYLALRTFVKRKPPSVASVGKKIGVGKESDIYVVADEAGEKRVLKLHRLGRISFRNIKSKRDYLGKRSSASWMYMSRLSAQKEFAFMKVLYDNGFPVPTPIDQARHCVVMSLIDSQPLRAVMAVPDPAELYGQLMEMIMRFARAGLIHGDFNEFNILIKRKGGEPVVIDFPQMVSTRHANAEYFFNRDVNCIRRFFHKRFRFEGTVWPVWADVLEAEQEADEAERAQAARSAEGATGGEGVTDGDEDSAPKRLRLDLEVEASGFGASMQRQLEDYMVEVQDVPRSDQSGQDEDSDDDDEEEEDEDEAEGSSKPEAPLSPEEEAAAAAARLEALRLHRALGNDGDPDAPSDDADDDETESEPESESDSDADSDDSTGVAASDYTQYTRAPRERAARVNVARVSKLAAVDEGTELRSVVAADMGRRLRDSQKHHSRKNTAAVGRARGQKWKSPSHEAKNAAKGKSDGW